MALVKDGLHLRLEVRGDLSGCKREQSTQPLRHVRVCLGKTHSKRGGQVGSVLNGFEKHGLTERERGKFIVEGLP